MNPLRLAAGPRKDAGFSLVGIAVWLVAIGIFVLPFLRPQANTDWDSPDPTRKLDYASDDDESPLDVPFWDDVAEIDEMAAESDWDFGAGLHALVSETSEAFFGLDSERLADLVDVNRLDHGERSYMRQCAGCHAQSGDGAGPAARYLSPRPRNFRKGLFKFTSTGSGARPLRTDLFNIITRGLSGSAMPPFNLLSEERRWDIAEWVRYMSMRGEYEQLMLDIAYADEELPDAEEVFEIVTGRWSEATLRPLFPTAAETPRDAASIERGKALFEEPTTATCFTCHGTSGKGDGPSADAYRDGWGYPIRPRDLTTGVFRAGSQGKDLFLTIANGIGGTPMPAYGDALTGEQIWDLVHYVQFLATPAAKGL